MAAPARGWKKSIGVTGTRVREIDAMRTGGWRGRDPRQPGTLAAGMCWRISEHAGSFVRGPLGVSGKTASGPAPI